MGIPITFSGLPRPAGEKEPGSHYGIGTIHLHSERGDEQPLPRGSLSLLRVHQIWRPNKSFQPSLRCCPIDLIPRY
jgi:hypothetical protein